MASRARQSVAPLYLLACLVLGGSAQGIWANMLLQLGGLAVIAWSALERPVAVLSRPALQLLWLMLAALAVVALQLVPLPFDVWARLGGRSNLAADFAVLGAAPPFLPASLTPYRGLATLLSWIPPIAMFCAVARLQAYRPSWLCAALIVGVAAGILLGALQVSSADYRASPWYLFTDVNFGKATGFFANANHMASLLVISLPFLAALAAAARGKGRQVQSAALAGTAAATLVILVGIVINRSLAGLTLLLPALAGSAMILLPPRSRWRSWAAAGSALLLLGAAGAMAMSAIGSERLGADAATSVESRVEMLKVTAQATRDFLPLGAGLGSFPEVYRLYEDPLKVSSIYVSHAHNDYAEVALELGLAGLLLIAVFLAWWAKAAWAAWRALGSQPYARAASIATAIVLVHSLVDFPLRTAAIGACFAMGLALLADRRAPTADARDLRPTRHLIFR